MIVLGSAVFAIVELGDALKLYPDADVIALNFMFKRAPYCDHVASADSNFFLRPEVIRDLKDIARKKTTHISCGIRFTQTKPLGADHLWVGMKDGSSGLFGARIARIIYDGPVVLAGIRMDTSGYVPGYKPGCHVEGHPGHDLETLREAWRTSHARGDLVGVTSMGGWTAELLGRP